MEYQKLQEDRKALKILRTVQKLAICKLFLGKAALRVKACSYLLVPFIAVGAGGIVGKMVSDNITEYATTTRKYDFETNTEIGIPKVEYDDRETSYVASVDVYEPWQKKPGGGYIRNVTSYEFEATAIEGKYHLTKDDIQNNLRELYTVSEVKNTLDLGDSMTETSIIVTETFQDKKNDKIKKYSRREYLDGYIKNEFLTEDGDADLFLNIHSYDELFDFTKLAPFSLLTSCRGAGLGLFGAGPRTYRLAPVAPKSLILSRFLKSPQSKCRRRFQHLADYQALKCQRKKGITFPSKGLS